jgi:hypothetical protein
LLSISGLLAGVVGLAVAALVALCLPTWAAASVAGAILLILAVGGEALLVKALMAGAVAAVVLALWRWRSRRQSVTVCEAKAKAQPTPQERKAPQRRAA